MRLHPVGRRLLSIRPTAYPSSWPTQIDPGQIVRLMVGVSCVLDAVRIAGAVGVINSAVGGRISVRHAQKVQ